MTPLFDRRSTDHLSEDDDNSWEAWRKLVLNKLDDMDQKFESFRDEMAKQNDKIIAIQLENASHKGKMAGIGAVVALVTSLIMQFIMGKK